ncbi:MAG: dihydroorotase family protein [Flavobacteriaceae bacterium]
MNLILKSATIIDPGNSRYHLKKRDIHIRNGRIEKIASKVEATGKTEVVQLKNLHISKGWLDSSVSFGEPGFEERETIANGLHTAALSGFTDIVLNPNTYPVPDSSGDIVFLKNASRGFAANLFPLGALTVKGQGKELAELFDMWNSGAVGFYDYKSAIDNSNLLKIALLYAQNSNGLVHSFPMDSALAGKGQVNEGEVATSLGLKGIPVLAETLQIARDLFILEYTGGKLHIPTISSGAAVKLIASAKKKGLDVSCSVALHNLFFDDEVLQGFDSAYKVMPPIRTKQDAKELLKGVKDGTIDYVTSDHTPIAIEEKHVEFDNAANGTIGLESAFPALNTLLGPDLAIEVLTRGRERFGLSSGTIKEGENAHLSLFNPDFTFEFSEDHVHSTSKNAIFLGAHLKGKAYGIVANGQWII